MKKQNGYTLVELMVVPMILLAIAGGVGWIWNIVKLCAMALDPITALLIVRIAGIFVPPLGAIVGYF